VLDFLFSKPVLSYGKTERFAFLGLGCCLVFKTLPVDAKYQRDIVQLWDELLFVGTVMI
jgi:hypothetical protein